MNWFFISPFSINVLNVTILLFFMIFFLFKIERKSKATLFLIASLIGVELVFISFFVIFSALDSFYSTLAWWLIHLMVFASIAMVQFAYHFPKNLHHGESRIALYLCIGAAVAAYPYYIYKTLTTGPLYSFEAYAYVFLDRPEMGVIIGSEILWMLVVFFRKAVLLSDYEYSGFLNRWSGPARLPARFIIACLRIARAKERDTKAIRRLIVIFFSPVILIAAIILAYEGLLSWEIVAHILGTGFMVIAFIFIVVYINSSSEPSTFMVKLIGISLGALLIAISFGASIAILIEDNAYEKERLFEVREVMKNLAKKEFTHLPPSIAYILSVPLHKVSSPIKYETVYVRDPGFSDKRITYEGRKVKKQALPSGEREPVRQYRKLTPLDVNDYYIHYDFPYDGKMYEVAFDYIPYRQVIGDTGVKLLYIIAGSVLFVIIVFPYFFSESLVKPLNVLLDGVKKVNNGDLKVVVPVKVEDEIGYLSTSFNAMVESIQDGREKLKGALEKQVKLTESYSFFVPKELLTFLKKESIIDIRLGDNVQLKMTILFSDIRSFTSLSERMTPQQNFNFINDCLGRIGPVVRDNNGFIDKYIGDAIMALFPYRTEDAVRAAVEMQEAVGSCNNRMEGSEEVIRIGTGINTGMMMLGTIGEEKRMEGTVISDAVNLASRLESLTKVYGSSVILSKTTFDSLENLSDYDHRYLDRVQVKGKREFVDIYEVFHSDSPELRELKIKTKEDFEMATKHYREEKFDEALRYFRKVLKVNSRDKAAEVYVKRCENIKKHGLPEGWEGVTVLPEK
ncbi:MAG: HAMP domain-containing protein [Deltaproteobacteria bacterium]|nr:HAMP domain-containing protein [Deltaproteobacteria bacterium]